MNGRKSMEGMMGSEDYEPPFRARSNTWPCNSSDDKDDDGNDRVETDPSDNLNRVPKKTTTRRNPWGPMSYAALITAAISSTPDKRLTLAQIYDWMVQNIPYFKDKGDSNSSAGWKNSIRHNLSLHQQFIRVQNEGTGKSSWWMLNPDAKPGKSSRKRAMSMDTKRDDVPRKRSRLKKKAEPHMNGMNSTPSPSSSVPEGLEMHPESPSHHHGFQLSPDFRPRAPSNASSRKHNKYPFSTAEHEIVKVRAMSPNFNRELSHSTSLSSAYSSGLDRYFSDELSNLPETMKLENVGFVGEYELTLMNNNANGSLPPFRSQYRMNDVNQDLRQYLPPSADNGVLANLGNGHPRSPPHRLRNGANYMSNLQVLSPAQSTPSISPTHSISQSSNFNSHCSLQSGYSTPVQDDDSLEQSSRYCVPSVSVSFGTTANQFSQVMGHLLSLNNSIPNDIDLNLYNTQGSLECDVEQVIRHELSVDGNLDFNFDNTAAGANNSSVVTSTHSNTLEYMTQRAWVH